MNLESYIKVTFKVTSKPKKKFSKYDTKNNLISPKKKNKKKIFSEKQIYTDSYKEKCIHNIPYNYRNRGRG